MAGPKKGVAFTFGIALVSRDDSNVFQTSPTLADGDVTISLDGGNFANITTLPTQIQTSGVLPVALSAAEMLADLVCVRFHDVAGDEWQDALVVINTETGTISEIDANVDDLAAQIGAAGAGLTALGDARLANLDAAISSRATPSDVAVSLAVSATEAAAVASGTAAIKPYHDWSQAFLSTVTADLASATKIWTVGKADRDNNTDAEALFFIEEAEGLTVLAQAACASTGLGALAISGSSGDWEIAVTLSAAATAALVQWRHKKGMTMSIKALVNGKTVDVWEGTLTISSATARAYS